MYCRDGCGQTFLALTQSVCICLVLLFASLCCVPRLHHPVRQVLRPLVVHHVEAGLAWVEWAQGYEAPWLTAVFERSSHSVSVGFYVSGPSRKGTLWKRLRPLWQGLLPAFRTAQPTSLSS